MLEIQRAQVTKAINLFSAMGLKFAVEVDGEIIGNMAVKKTKVKRESARKVNREQYKPLDHLNKIRAMELGDAIEFEMLQGMNLDDLQSTIGAAGAHAFGKGNFTTSRDKRDNGVYVIGMRLG